MKLFTKQAFIICIAYILLNALQFNLSKSLSSFNVSSNKENKNKLLYKSELEKLTNKEIDSKNSHNSNQFITNKKVKKRRNFFTKAANAIGDAAESVGKAVKKGVHVVGDAAKSVGKAVKKGAEAVGDYIFGDDEKKHNHNGNNGYNNKNNHDGNNYNGKRNLSDFNRGFKDGFEDANKNKGKGKLSDFERGFIDGLKDGEKNKYQGGNSDEDDYNFNYNKNSNKYSKSTSRTHSESSSTRIVNGKVVSSTSSHYDTRNGRPVNHDNENSQNYPILYRKNRKSCIGSVCFKKNKRISDKQFQKIMNNIKNA